MLRHTTCCSGLPLLQVEKPSDITAAGKLIFPGVGSFGQAMDVLKKRDYIQPLIDYIQARVLLLPQVRACKHPTVMYC
jgi:glutamine amidotransferase/cyclase